MTKDEKTSKFKGHVLEIARIAKHAGELLDLKADAQQACFATIMIAAGNQGVFFDIGNPELPPNGHTEKDRAAAAKADAQIQDVSKQPSPEQAEAGAMKALRDGVKRACLLLNQEGYTPVLSNISQNGKPSTLDEYIKTETQLDKPLAEFDSEDLEALIKNLSHKLDTFRHNKSGLEEGAGF